MDCRACLLILLCAVAPLNAGAPAQFTVWGTAAQALPPAPAGWREARDPQPAAGSLQPTAEERARGFVLFARDPFVPVGPSTTPLPPERAEAVAVRMARGEYEPVTFSIHALRPLAGVAVSAGALRCGEAVIPADHVDVRVVRAIRVAADAAAKTWRWEPFLLEKRAEFALPQGRTARIWLTLHAPEAAKPGTYEGEAVLAVGGRRAATVRLSIRVLPFALPPAPVEMALFLPRPPTDDALLRKQLIDLREHGCNGFDPAFAAEVVTRDRVLGDDDIAAIQAHARRMMKATREVFGRWPEHVRFSVGHQIAYYWDKPKNWFAFWPKDERTESDFLRAIGVVRGLAEREGWPPLLAFAQDEAGAHRLLDEARHYYALIKQRAPGLATCTTIGGGTALGTDELGQLGDVIDFFATNRFTPELARGLVERGKTYGVYNGAGHTPAGARFFFGFWGWKTGASQVAQWVYHFGSGALEGGLRQGDEGYTYMAADGPVPSPMWEAVREGIDDYRTIHLLRQRLAGAKGPAAERARRDLEAVVGSIPWGFQALRTEDRRPPPHPSALRKWRGRLADHIAALGETAMAGEPKPPSPLELPWLEPAKETIQYGKELLPPSGFEKDMAPWLAQPWNGKGTGELETKERHGGRQSVRIAVPAASGADAVTVLVWPSWGRGGLKLRLDGDRVYEFSAWVKWLDRQTPPSVRVVLPEGAARSTRGGKDEPTPDGWQRIWLRTEMAFPAVPKYLALWVQGPGTVWADDLSLREVIPSPLALSLDQDEFDGLDRTAELAVSVRGRITPAALRLRILRGDEVVSEVAAPYESDAVAGAEGSGALLLAPTTLRRCRFILEPGRLEPGSYQARVELLDSQGRPIADESVQFQRIAD